MARKNQNVNGYYNPVTIEKFSVALREAVEKVQAGEPVRVSISNSNSKMGAVASVSTLPFLTCPSCCAGTCGPKCYAAKLANLRPSCLKSYAMNTAIAIYRPDLYWSAVDLAIKAVRFFRFHVSGDIIDKKYFAHMIDAARNNPHCEILCFTKKFDIVNAWIDENGDIPANLHLLFSGWTNLTPVNPHSLPETNVIEKGAEPAENWKICGGNCFNCACRGVGCWQAQRGDVIAFPIH